MWVKVELPCVSSNGAVAEALVMCLWFSISFQFHIHVLNASNMFIKTRKQGILVLENV